MFCLLLCATAISETRTLNDLVLKGQKELHIFIGIASNPTLLQMIEFSKLDKKVPKIIAWHRNRGVENRIDLKEYNTVEMDLYAYKASSSETYRMSLIIKENMRLIRKFILDHPDISICLHLNMMHLHRNLEIMKDVPIDRIKHLYFYEDGLGNVLYSLRQKYNNIMKNDIKKWKKLKDIIFDDLYNLSKNLDSPYVGWQNVIPTTYYIGFLNKLKKSTTYKTQEYIIGDYAKNVDYNLLGKTLSKKRKTLITKMLGIDVKKLKEEIFVKGKKSLVFLTGAIFVRMGIHNFTNNTISTLHSFFKEDGKLYKFFKKVKDKNYNIIIKQHPGAFDTSFVWNILHKAYPDLKQLPQDLPFEILLILGIKPDYICGTISSIFFSIPKKQVLFCIVNNDYFYSKNFLIQEGILDRDKVIFSKDVLP